MATDLDAKAANLLPQIRLSTRVLFACFKLVYYFVEFYGNLPKPFKYGFLFFAKFKTFLLKRLNATPDGTRLAAFFILPRIGQRLERIKCFDEERTCRAVMDSTNPPLNHKDHPLSGSQGR